jgi:predicted HTH transcriptional regulator
MTTLAKLRIFVSSVRKELEHERAAVAQLISVDPFLLKHCEAVLFDKEPPVGRPNAKAYLDCVRSCQIYLLIVDVEYGRAGGDLSATHEEYRLAQATKLPTLVFIRGLDSKRDAGREAKTNEFIAEIKRDGYKYVRFHDREDLKPALRSALYAVLKKEFHLEASDEESEDGKHLIEVASSFETAPMPDVSAQSLDVSALASFVQAVIEQPEMRIWDDAPEHALVTRGLAMQRPGEPAIVNRAAYLLFAPRPANRFPQAEILVDAYADTKVSGKPRGQLNVNAPLLAAIEQVLEFVDKHTFHPTRVVGINNLTLDEYPVSALREALVNAVAHRNYEDASRKIAVQVFSDRIVVASPGYPPAPLTLAKLRKGNYRACSRNPLVAQALATLKLMEQRGSGFARMRDAMLNHGLDAPAFSEQDGYFVVTFPGPNGNYDRIKTPESAAGLVSPAVEAQLNDRQKKMVAMLVAGEELTSRRCEAEFQVTRPVTAKDLGLLVKLGLAQKVASGRSTRYRLKPQSLSNR